MKINKEVLYFFDFETDGLKSYINPACSCFIKKYNSVFEKNFLFYPQKTIYNIEALNINNLTLEELYQRGSSRNEFIKTIKSMSEAINKQQDYIILCAWNVEFDINFLLQIFKEKKENLPCPIVSFDLMEVAKKNIKKKDLIKKDDSGVDNYKLITIYKHYFNDVEEEKTHTAKYDVLMLEKLYIKFKEFGWC